MIKGNGIDVIEVERIKKNIQNEVFMKKLYTKNELEYLKTRKYNPQTAAGIFAAKEAVSKSLGTGFSTFGPLDIEILKNEMGKPIVLLLNKALEIAKDNNITNIQLSITHIKEYAIASCIAEGED